MVEKINWRRAIGNVIFGLLFSLFVAEFANLFHPLLAPLSLIPKLIVDLFGIWCIGIGISVIQRANFVLHPLDNLTNVARFKFFRGSAPLGQLSNFIFAVTISLICWALSGKLLSYGIGTIYCFFLQGNNIAWGINIFLSIYCISTQQKYKKADELIISFLFVPMFLNKILARSILNFHSCLVVFIKVLVIIFCFPESLSLFNLGNNWVFSENPESSNFCFDERAVWYWLSELTKITGR